MKHDGGLVNDTDEALAVGARIRWIRSRRRITLKTLSERAGLSESFLSQLERGLTQASVSSMRRIAEALGIQISDLFTAEGERARVLRREDRPSIEFGDGAKKYLLTSRQAVEHMEVLYTVIEVGGSTGLQAYAHGDSDELVVVISGSVKLELGEEFFHLEEGDSILYRSSETHRILNDGSEPCQLMWVISPPSY
jgi:transcriptional regulator with XRE-family HTH domain